MQVNRRSFPTVALLLSVPLLAVVIFGGGPPRLPLLGLLLVAELGLIVNLVAAYFGIGALREQPRPRGALLRFAANLVLAEDFGRNLLILWPG
jgi:hypothetical protein